MLLLRIALALLASAAPLCAQSMNIDVCRIGFYDPPSASYGGPAGQAGAWCFVLPGNSFTLADVHDNGVETAFSSSTGAGVGSSFDHPGTSGDDQLLLDDYASFGPQGAQIDWNIGPLFEGEYTVYTCAWNPQSSSALTEIAVAGALQAPQPVGGAWSGAHVLGTTYARHTLHVPAQGFVHVTATALGSEGCLNGFQLVRDEPGIPYCFGDGSLVPCPCGNDSTPGLGRGCQYSSQLGSMNLFVCGSTAPNDTIVLVSHAQNARPHGGLRVYMQGTASIAPVAFGDGLRCVGGALKRLYARNNANGLGQSVPGAGDLSVSAQSAALGDALAPGSTRYYTAYYRDGSSSFCPAPFGSTFNVTNSYQLTW